MRCTCEKTVARRSRINPSPIRAEYHRWVNESPATEGPLSYLAFSAPCIITRTFSMVASSKA